jgi:DNA polymerase kappa
MYVNIDDICIEQILFVLFKVVRISVSGIAPNMMLAKVCSDKNKPNGQYKIEPNRETVMEFIKNLPTRKVC